MERLRAIGLTTGYRHGKREYVVEEDITASLESGELTVLLGRNGTGKSTLMRTLAGFQAPLRGRVEICRCSPLEEAQTLISPTQISPTQISPLGEAHHSEPIRMRERDEEEFSWKDIGSLKTGELAKMVGMVLTEKPLLENMKVEELVALGRAPYTGFWGGMDDADHKAVERAISLVGIENLRERDVSTLSDGERQKAMIAKVLAQETAVIFLDEPTAFLDYPSKIEMMTLLRKLAREEDKTIFVSTHDLEIAVRIADRFWCLVRCEAYTRKGAAVSKLIIGGREDKERLLKECDMELFE